MSIQCLGNDQCPGVSLVSGNGGVSVIVYRIVKNGIDFAVAVMTRVVAAVRPAGGNVGRIVRRLPARVHVLCTFRYLYAVLIVMYDTKRTVRFVKNDFAEGIRYFEKQNLYASFKAVLCVEIGAEVYTLAGSCSIRVMGCHLHGAPPVEFGIDIGIKDGQISHAESGNNANLTGNISAQGKRLAFEFFDQANLVTFILCGYRDALHDMETLRAADAAHQRGFQRDLQSTHARNTPIK